MPKLTGAEALIESLKEEGVEHIFGIPGGAMIDVYDDLYDESGINHILTRHEQGAAHAADGYAR
ncbi:MAG: acetolactate synthase large subunit, partial [Hadesarchaea archaeon]|nr:acetolactate synthase large subunit [Hadesarchaea archaeon]